MKDEEIILVDSFMLISKFIKGRGGKFKIQGSINRRVHWLYHKFDIRREDITGHLQLKFRIRQRHLKWDPARSPLEIYVAFFIYYGLLNLECECKRHQERCPEIPLSQLPYGDTISTIGRSVENYEGDGIEGLIDRDTPHDFLEGKELLEMALKHFGKNDLAVILGASDRSDEAIRSGINYYTYCKRLQRKIERFKIYLEGIGYFDK
jgi:hypothetical protein